MPVNTLTNVFDAARGYLNDQAGEIFTNAVLQVSFNEPYRRMFSCLMDDGSKRVQRFVYITLPVSNTVIIPASYGIVDMAEPSLLEERPALSTVAITSTTNATPISVLATGHGFGAAASVVEGIVGQVAGTSAPWGQWFFTITDANNFTLNGSAGDGTAGTGGIASLSSLQQFTPMYSTDFARDIDGQPTTSLGNYLWENERIYVRGASNPVQIRITYWASGAPPTNANTTIGIDNCIDFLACATAANAARSVGWMVLADQLKTTAYGSTQDTSGQCSAGLLGDFIRAQVRGLQRGPQRRQLPFRAKRTRYGDAVFG